ncbi:MAG: GAF domain-containing protein [Thermoleophilia bacterium]
MKRPKGEDMGEPDRNRPALSLRERAEQLLRSLQPDRKRDNLDLESAKLIHELQVHQVELEMQQEELVEARDELERSVAKYADLFDNAPVGYIILDEQRLVIDANRSSARMMNLEKEELLGKPMVSRIAGEHSDYFNLFLKRIFKLGRRQTAEAKIIKQDHGMVYTRFHGVPVRDDGGKVTRARVTMADITELRLMTLCNEAIVHAGDEASLVEEVCRLIVDDGSFDFAWIGYAELDENGSGQVVPSAQCGAREGPLEPIDTTRSAADGDNGPVNTAIRTRQPIHAQSAPTGTSGPAGKNEELLRGYHSSLTLPLIADSSILGVLCIYANDLEAFDTNATNLLMQMANDVAYGIMSQRTRAENKAATASLLESEASLIKAANELSVRNDIADILLMAPAEEMYSRVTDTVLAALNSPAGVFGYFDDDGSLVAPGMSGASWDDCQVEDKHRVFRRHASVDNNWAEANRNMMMVCVNEPSTATPGGHPAINRHVSTPIIHQGVAIGLIQVANKPSAYGQDDLSLLKAIADIIAPVLDARIQGEHQERRRQAAEDEQERLRGHLMQVQKLETIGQLAGGIAHDFNNYLTAIIGNLDLAMMNQPPDSEIAQELGDARVACERSANLTRQLLLFSRREHVEMKPIATNQAVTGLLKMLNRIIGEDYAVQTRLADDTPYINADAGHIEQVLVNLVINARDALPDGGTILIETAGARVEDAVADAAAGQPGGDFTCISVSDRGVGMDPGSVPRIFEPFYTTKNKAEGSGLGLAVVYGIVAQHNGWVDVQTTPGEGSTFTVFIPTTTAAAAEAEAITLTPQARGSGQKVLVVEDEEVVRKLATRLLARNGYQVTAAADAEEAITVFQMQGDDFDLLFSDVILPGKNGVWLADKLRQLQPELPVLLTSGYNELKDWHSIKRNGYEFMSKPYSLPDLIMQVAGLMEPDGAPPA